MCRGLREREIYILNALSVENVQDFRVITVAMKLRRVLGESRKMN